MVKYQVHIIHIVHPRRQHKGTRNEMDIWCDTPHAAERTKRLHFQHMRGSTTQVAIDIRKVEVDDEEPEEIETTEEEQATEIAKLYPELAPNDP